METTSFILIPYWIEKALKRNKLSLKDVLNYQVIRRFLSLEDLAGLVSFQQSNGLEVFNNFYNGVLLSSWEKTSGPLKAELGSAVIPLSDSEEVKNYVSTRLNAVENINDVDELDFYKIVDIERNTFCIIVKEGFNQRIAASFDLMLNFIRNILRVFYVYHSVDVVSKQPLFKTYVDMLNGSTPKN